MKKMLAVTLAALLGFGTGGAIYGADAFMTQMSAMREEVLQLKSNVDGMKKDLDVLRAQLASYQERYKKMYE